MSAAGMSRDGVEELARGRVSAFFAAPQKGGLLCKSFHKIARRNLVFEISGSRGFSGLAGNHILTSVSG